MKLAISNNDRRVWQKMCFRDQRAWIAMTWVPFSHLLADSFSSDTNQNWNRDKHKVPPTNFVYPNQPACPHSLITVWSVCNALNITFKKHNMCVWVRAKRTVWSGHLRPLIESPDKVYHSKGSYRSPRLRHRSLYFINKNEALISWRGSNHFHQTILYLLHVWNKDYYWKNRVNSLCQQNDSILDQ